MFALTALLAISLISSSAIAGPVPPAAPVLVVAGPLHIYEAAAPTVSAVLGLSPVVVGDHPLLQRYNGLDANFVSSWPGARDFRTK